MSINIKRRADIIKELGKSFIYADQPLSALTLGIELGLAAQAGKEKPKNVILYGNGGFAKSEMAKAAYGAYGIKPPMYDKDGKLLEESKDVTKHLYVKTLSAGTAIEDLLGGIDMPLMTKEGKIEYLLENSFMNYPYVIFEEALDCPPAVLSALKDILTEGSYRGGTQVFTSKVVNITILTNRSPAEFADADKSIQALMERFPLGCEVAWASMEIKDYRKLFQTVFENHAEAPYKEHEEMYGLIAELVGDTNGKQDKANRMSPRSAVWLADVIRAADWNLAEARNIRGIDPDKIMQKAQIIIARQKERKAFKEIEKDATAFKNLTKYITALPTEAEFSKDFDKNGPISTQFIENKQIYNRVSELLDTLTTSSDPEIQKRIMELMQIKRDLSIALTPLFRTLDTLLMKRMTQAL